MTIRGALRRIVMAGALALLAVAPGLLVPGSAKAGGEFAVAEGEYAIDQFYDELSPYGEWVEHSSYGYVWLPRTIAPDWQPYTVGSWVYTDDHGWYWDSNEPFAWAVYHYGRWGFESDYGWYWVPGDTWAPAWVQWRYGDEYVGWAPEGPAASAGYAYGGPARYAPPPPQESWTFVQPRYLTEPAVRSYAVPRVSLSIVFSRTTFVSRPRYRNGYLYNYGMPRDYWQRVTRRDLVPRRVYRGHYRTRPVGWNRGPHRGVYVYAPRVKKGVHPQKRPTRVVHKPVHPKAKASSKKERIARGNRAAGFKSPNPLGPRGVMNPNYRGPGANSSPIGNYKAFEGRKPPQAKSKASTKGTPKAATRKVSKPRAAASKLAKPTSAKPTLAKSGPPKARVPGNRVMSLAPPTSRTSPRIVSPRGRHSIAQPKSGDGRKPSFVRTSPKPVVAKPQTSKRHVSRPPISKLKASIPRAPKSVKARASKPKTAYAKPTSVRVAPKARPKATAHRPAQLKSAKPPSARSAVKPSGKSNKGANRTKNCKANPKSCGRRG